jgi:signal transduction histidine kinase
MEHGSDQVRAIVEDDGTGFDVSARSWHPSAASGFGLFSIRERIGHLGGTVEIESRPGDGTRVQITVPGRIDKEAGVVHHEGGQR